MKRYRLVTSHQYIENGTRDLMHDAFHTAEVDEFDKEAIICGMLANGFRDHGPNFVRTFSLTEFWSTGIDRKTVTTFVRVA